MNGIVGKETGPMDGERVDRVAYPQLPPRRSAGVEAPSPASGVAGGGGPC